MLVVDNFAGGGGASLGIEQALGRPIDIAVNHDPEAVAMHRVNHPQTEHHTQDVWSLDPAEIRKRGRIGLVWFSPDCTHHSKAKGSRPIRSPEARKSRDLAWVVVRWAEEGQPDVIMLENVEEFEDWGPLTPEGKPDRGRMGETFRQWVGKLEDAGYVVDWRRLRACDFGAPTVRRRMFLVARRDGLPICWPDPTHGPGREPFRTAAECIDWALPVYSIFLTAEEGKRYGVRRPLADKTMQRIARGVYRYVINASRPFIVPITRTDSTRAHSIDEPLRTITTARGGEFALVAPWMAQHNTGVVGHDAREPVSTIVGKGSNQNLVTCMLSRQFGGSVGQAVDEPAPTVMPKGGGKTALVTAELAAAPFFVPRYTERPGQEPRALSVEAPHPTIVPTGNGAGLVAAFLSNQHGSNTGGGQGDLLHPTNTVLAGGQHKALVKAFLLKYYSTNTGSSLFDPSPTVTVRDRLGLVMVGETPYEIADIGMRMLSARELFRAQGFPDDYVIEADYGGKPLTKTAQIRMCGNSVSPHPARALVAANFLPVDTRMAA